MQVELRLVLRDLNAPIVNAWSNAFAGLANADIAQGNILENAADAIVSPANSFGFMDGGIDLAYSRFFGGTLQMSLQELIRTQHFGELPVGRAVIIDTKHSAIPFLVSAPTMRVPEDIAHSANVYLAFRAALIAVIEHNLSSDSPIASLLVPGLGIGVGGMPAARAARQMRAAYDAIAGSRPDRKIDAATILYGHHSLVA